MPSLVSTVKYKGSSMHAEVSLRIYIRFSAAREKTVEEVFPGSEANVSRRAEMKIPLVSGGWSWHTGVSLRAKEGWNKVVYRHRSIFLRWFASLHIRRLGTGNISSNPRHVCSTPFHPPTLSPLLFVHGYRSSVETTRAIRRFEKRITALSSSVSARRRRKTTFVRAKYPMFTALVTRRLDYVCSFDYLDISCFRPFR